MNLVKLNNHKEIYENQELSDLIALCIYNPTPGKIQNIAQSIYSKQQWNFYMGIIDNKVIGIIGVKIIDNLKLEIYHIAVLEEYRLQGIAKKMISEVMVLEGLKEISCEANHKIYKFFKKCGFKCWLIKNEMLGSENYHCSL